MRNPTAREPKFPTACARCGGRISEPVAFCPHCGAHARFALAGHAVPAGGAQRPRGGAASPRVEPNVPSYDFEGDLDPPWPGPPTPLFASPDGDPYGEVRAPGIGRGWGLKGGTVLVVAAFVILYGGALAVHRYDGASPLSQSSASKAVEGAIGSNGGNDANMTAPSSGDVQSNGNALQPPAPIANRAAPAPAGGSDGARSGNSPPNGSPANGLTANTLQPAPRAGDSMPPDTSIASLPPPAATMQAQPNFGVAPPPPQTNVAPAQTQAQPQPSGGEDSSPSVRTRRHAARSAEAQEPGDSAANANANVRSQQYRARSQRDDAQLGRAAAAARAVTSAQVQLAKSDLRGARASIDRALASDPRNGDALALREQLISREQERDASLGAAHACVVQSRWNCVWHNAGKALAVDASSTEAKVLVNRAIVESGAATAPAGPGPDNVQVPMVQ